MTTGGLVSERLIRRVRADFPARATADDLVRRLALLVDPDGGSVWVVPEARERIQAAIVLSAQGDEERFADSYRLAQTDWRDILIGAGLEHPDWPTKLFIELGPP